jgi:hypothetical protein
MSADPLQEAENLKLDGSRFFQVGNAHDALMRYKKVRDKFLGSRSFVPGDQRLPEKRSIFFFPA